MRIRGTVTEVGTRDVLYDPVNSNIWILKGKTIVGRGKVDRDDNFDIEIPDDVGGQLELKVDILGAAPVLFTVDDRVDEIDLVVMVNRGGSNFLV